MIKVLLIVVQGKPEGKTIPLTGPNFKIGRGEGCHLRPNSDQVSREHAEILVADETASIRDLGSRNGTLLNGRGLTGTAVLKSGDLVQIGPLTFAVAIHGAAAAAKPFTPTPGKSLDDVSGDQIDSWLIADNNRPTPDRPSGVYDGDTLTLNAYNASKPPSSTSPTPTKAPSSVAPAAAAPARPAPAVAAPPRPAEPIPAAQPVAPIVEPAPAPVAPPVVEPVAVAAPPAPVAPPVVQPVAAAQPAPVKPTVAATPVRSLEDMLGEIEHLPEGVGDNEPGDANQEADGNDDDENEDEGDEEPALDEMMDESNPFYVPKNKKTEEAAKPSFKDSSDAANDILRKMLDRRRAAKS